MKRNTSYSHSILLGTAGISLVVAVVALSRPAHDVGDASVANTQRAPNSATIHLESLPSKLTAKRVAALREFLVNDVSEPLLVYASIAVQLPLRTCPFSPLYWLQVWHRPPCGIIIVPIFSRRGAARPRQLIFDAEMFEKIEADEDLKRRVRSMEDPSLGKPSRFEGGVL